MHARYVLKKPHDDIILNMAKDSEILTTILGKVIIKSQNSCLAAAQNKFLIDIGTARNVNIENVSIVQLAKAIDSKCSQDVEIDIGSLEFDIQQSLDQSIQSADEDDTSTTLLIKNNITNSLRKGNIEGCISSAVNDYKASFGELEGNVDFINFSLKQFATAEVTKCIQEANFKVGEQTLADYLDETFTLNKNISIIPPESSCEEIKVLYYIMYGCIAGALFLVICFSIWYFVWRKKYASKT